MKNSKKYQLQKIINKVLIKKFENGISIYKLFKGLKKSGKNSFCYFSVFSQYGRLLCYSEIKNQYGSTFKEHTF